MSAVNGDETAAADSNLIKGEYIVVFKDQYQGKISDNIAQKALGKINSLIAAYSISEDSVLFRYKNALKGFAAKLSPSQVRKLMRNPQIEKIYQAHMYHLGVKRRVLESSQQDISTSLLTNGQIIPWGVEHVEGQKDGTGKKAWIIDSGIDLDNPDLNVDVANSVSFIANESADDQIGHGTHVAGTIAAKNNSINVVGVAAGATVVAVKVCNSLPDNDPNAGCPEPALLNGIDYVSNHAASADIVNMSIWGPGNSTLDNHVINAANNDVRFVLIAGNAGADANNYSPGRANAPNIWTVSAHDLSTLPRFLIMEIHR